MDEVLDTLRLFPKQCQQAWEETQGLNFPNNNFNSLTVCSMGASSFGYYVIKSLFEQELKIPLLLNSDYHLPGYVNSNSLLYLSSYSGSTEETIACFYEGQQKEAHIIGATQTNSRLGKLMTENKYNYYQINPIYNPSGQPRMAVGYTVVGMIGILHKLGIIKTQFPLFDNLNTEAQAKVFAGKLVNKQIILIAAEHLQGNAHILRNQFNESSKNMAFYNLLPELNHHMLEGLSHPDSVKKDMKVVIFNSSLYSDKIKKRVLLTKEVLEKNGLSVICVDVLGKTLTEQVFWTLSFGGFVSYFLSLANHEDAKSIPWVDYFKKRLNE